MDSDQLKFSAGTPAGGANKEDFVYKRAFNVVSAIWGENKFQEASNRDQLVSKLDAAISNAQASL